MLSPLAAGFSSGVESAASSSSASGALTRLLPPPDGQCYFGFTFRLHDATDPAVGDTRPFHERIQDSITNELRGKTPTFLTVWADWQASDQPGQPLVPFSTWDTDIATARNVTGPDSLLYLDWTLTNPGADRADYNGITTKDIAAGVADDYIRQYAAAIKDYAGPVLIRLFGGEFNGSWWYSQSPFANHNLAATDFVNAWRRVVDIFRQTGALNASFAWIPNAVPAANRPGWIDPNIGAYYPGDDYVDWGGADMYDFEPVSDLNSVYDFAVAHGKPFFLAEWGVRHSASALSPTEQRDWIESMFGFFTAHDDVKAINYFNYNNRSGGPVDPTRTVYLDGGEVNYQANTNDNDSRLLADSGAGFRSTYANGISQSRFTSSVLTQTINVQKPATATATIVSVTVRGQTATMRWAGTGGAATFDLAVRRIPGSWTLVRARYTGHTYTLRGKHNQRFAIRVRGRNRSGTSGPWSTPRTLTLR